MLYTFEQADELLNSIQKKQPKFKEIITFFKEILRIQLKMKNDYNLPFLPPDKEKTKQNLEKGSPLLELPSSTDLSQALTLLRAELSALIKKRGPRVAEHMEKIEHYLLQDGSLFFSLSQNFLLHTRTPLDDFAQKNDLDYTLLLFYIKQSLKPFVESMSEKISANCDLSSWSGAFCPICGSLPALSFLKPIGSDGSGLMNKGKKRNLSCSLCNHTWPFPRLKCPFCLTDKQDALGYFYLDDEKGYRVDICSDCKGYIKTIDFEYTLVPEELIFLENIQTLDLDILAEKEGYCKKAEDFFLL